MRSRQTLNSVNNQVIDEKSTDHHKLKIDLLNPRRIVGQKRSRIHYFIVGMMILLWLLFHKKYYYFSTNSSMIKNKQKDVIEFPTSRLNFVSVPKPPVLPESNVLQDSSAQKSITTESESFLVKKSHEHPHIPSIIIFTHYVQLLKFNISDNEKEINKTNFEELIALKKNVLNTISLHSNSTIRFLTDDDCIRSLGNVLGTNHELINYFRNEKVGMYKADIFII